MNRIRFWPFGALAVLVIAVVAAIAAAVLFKYQRSAKASELPNAARIERVDGQVGINQSPDNSANGQWIAATANMPVSVGDRIYTKENSKTEVAFTGRNFATADANTSLDILDLSEQRTQVALRGGSALFDVGAVPSGGLFEVATPCGAVDLEQPGIYQVAINENGNAVATAFSGEAQVVGQGGSGRIQKGENLAVSCQGSSPAVMSRVEPNQAGSLIDNYYRYRYPKTYDGRYRSYYTYLDDPYYYDPARRYSSYNYVSEYIPGVDDLDDYGDWQYVSNYGYCWHPRVNTAWVPYQSGYWTMDYPYGLTWVSSEPWGYAPYHYGRWTYASNEWFWVPESARTYPTYSPALVAFIPFSQSSVAWVALGPTDPYVARYYDPNWQPTYLYSSNVVVDRVVNIGVPGAVTVVPAQEFTRVIDPTIITRVDPQMVVKVHPVLDPLNVDALRAAAFKTREARARIDVPRELQERMARTPVVVSNAPAAPPFRRDLARALRVEPIADRAKNQKLQITDQRAQTATQTNQSSLAADQARERQMADLAKQAARGDRNAQQQMQELRRQQVAEQRLGRANVQAQGERVGQPTQDQRQLLRQQQQAQKDAERQQMITSQQQRKQTEMQRAQVHATRSSQPQAVRPQVQEQRREPKPPQYQRSAQPRVMAPQQTQVRPQGNPGRAAPQSQPVRQPQAQPRAQAQPKPQAVQQQKAPAQPKAPEQKGGAKKKPPER